MYLIARIHEKEIASLHAATAGPSGLELSDVRLTEIRTKLSATPQADRFAKMVDVALGGLPRLVSPFLARVKLPLFEDFHAPTPVTSARPSAGNAGFVVIQTHLSLGF